MSNLALWQWVLLGAATAIVGFSKTGIAGFGIVAVALFAMALPSRESVGAVLPLFLCGDIFAVSFYRRHSNPTFLWKLVPPAIVGNLIGYLAMGRMNDAQAAKLIGAILLGLIALQMGRRIAQAARQKASPEAAAEEPVPDSIWIALALGMVAGFATMVANAAGPIVVLYFLAMRLPKMEFMGTMAWYFLLLNSFKLPFHYSLGLINPASLALDLHLTPFLLFGALLGRLLIRHVDQKLFEMLAMALTAAAAVKLLL